MNLEHHFIYQPTSAAIPFTFSYPAGWQVREIIEGDGAEAFVLGPRNEANTYSAAFTIRVWSMSTNAPEEAVADFCERHGQLADFAITAQGAGEIDRNPALEVEVSYTTQLPLYSTRAERTQMRAKRIFARSGNAMLELIYIATAEMYEDWLPAFHELANSLTLVADLPSESYPVPNQLSALPVQETPPDYDEEIENDAQP